MPIVSDLRRRLCCALPLLLCLAPSLQAADLAADKAKANVRRLSWHRRPRQGRRRT